MFDHQKSIFLIPLPVGNPTAIVSTLAELVTFQFEAFQEILKSSKKVKRILELVCFLDWDIVRPGLGIYLSMSSSESNLALVFSIILENKPSSTMDIQNRGKISLYNLPCSPSINMGYTMVIHMQVKRRLGPKGQIVLPKDIREMLGVKPGSEVILEVTGDEVKIKPANKPETYFDRFGNTSRKLTKLVDIKKIIEEEYQ